MWATPVLYAVADEVAGVVNVGVQDSNSPEARAIVARYRDAVKIVQDERLQTETGPGGVPRGRQLLVLLGRVALGAATAILGVNLWTGFPLLALWVGSQLTGGRLLSMTGVAAAVVTLAALLTLGVFVLARISASYDRLTRRPPAVRQPPPWLLSMRASKAQPARGRREMNAIEAIVIGAVVAAFIAFEIWFLFLATARL